MADIIKCPNCGASDAEKKGELEYECNYCESQFIVGAQRKKTTVDDALRQLYNRPRTNVVPSSPRSFRLVSLMIFITVIGVSVSIFLSVNNAVNNAMDQATQSGPGKISEDDYWGSASILKFQIFEGEKGPVIWMMMNQSSKGLDSAKYTLQLVDPKKKKVIHEGKFMTMTWKEGFDFGNHLTDMISDGKNSVYFLSDENGMNVYDLYSGKIKFSNEKFAVRFPQLKSGIISSKNVYYKNAIELLTNDGYKFYYFPAFDKLVSEADFNDYKKNRGLIGGFVVSGEPRQKLYYIISVQDTLRNDFSFSEYYLKEYLRKGNQTQSKGEKGFAVDTSKTFFNVNFLLRNSNQVIFVYTAGLAKNSEASIISYSKNDFLKPLWEVDLGSVKYFENAVKDGFYLRTYPGKKELVVWYESANKIAFGLDLRTGKINWNYSVK